MFTRHNSGKSPFLIGKSTVNGPFSIAILTQPEGIHSIVELPRWTLVSARWSRDARCDLSLALENFGVFHGHKMRKSVGFNARTKIYDATKNDIKYINGNMTCGYLR